MSACFRIAAAWFWLLLPAWPAAEGQIRAHPDYGKLPLAFEANSGLWEPGVKFAARASGHILLFEASGAMRIIGPPGSAEQGGATVGMRLLGARPQPVLARGEPLEGKNHYLLGSDPARWRLNVPTFSRIEYREVYPGVMLVYRGNQRQLEYDFVLASGVSPGVIRLDFTGTQAVQIAPGGELVVRTPWGELRHHRPRVYQEVDGARVEIAGRYRKLARHQVGFQVAAYDPLKPLVIDPIMSYSTYLGGSADDRAYGIAVDSAGCAYIVGETWSSNFPRVPGYQPASAGERDVFVAKLNATGTSLVYSTYIGGRGRDSGRSIAVDASGSAYVTGFTYSQNFPVTAGAFQTSSGGQEEAFALKLNASGTGLLYSTYLGGRGSDFGAGIAVHSNGEALLCGYTSSPNFPTTSGALRSAFAGGYYDAFVAKLNASGSGLVYSTYLGGGGTDTAAGIAVDAGGNAYVTGQTGAADFPTRNPFQTLSGFVDAFVTKLDPSGQLVYSTYLGGRSSDFGNSVAVDSSGSAYVSGATASTDFPVTAGSYQTSNHGSYDVFVAKLNPQGTALVYSTLLGGAGAEEARGIAVSGSGQALVAGWTYSIDFPTQTPVQGSPGGNGDGFVAVLNSQGSALYYSTYLGGSGSDNVQAIATDPSGNAYVTGWTLSSDYPITAGAVRSTSSGSVDAFVSKIGANLPPSAMSVSPASGTGASQTFRLEYSDPNGFADLSLVQVIFHNVLDGVGSCYILYNRAGNTMYLAFDSGMGATSLPVVSASGSLENSQCVVNVGGTTVSGSGNSLVLNIPITFKPVFGGLRNVYMLAVDNAGQVGGWYVAGSWTVTGTPPQPPSSMTVSPNSGSGAQRVFRFVYTDPNGAADFDLVQLLFNTGVNGVGACYILYHSPSNSTYLAVDAGMGSTGPAPPGAPVTLQNSQCSLNLAASAVSRSGNDLILDLSLSFKASFAGARNVYMCARDKGGLSLGWLQAGAWTVP